MIKHSFCFFIVLSLASLACADQNFYRYTDENGTVVINSSISPRRASMGYEILDKNGQVIKKVAPALTDDQLAEYLKKKEQEQQQLSDSKKQEQYDISLLQRYSFVSDIEAAQKREIAQLNTKSAILRGNLNSFRSDLEKTYEQSADYDRQGKPVPDKIKERIAGLEERISTTEGMLKAQQEEVDTANKKYEKAIERFKQLDKLRGRQE